jgi:hypothetical protein
MLSSQEEQIERIETIENDRLVREAEQRRIQLEGTTMHQHAQSAANDEAGGRFASVNPTTVVGAQPLPVYPQLPSSSPWSGTQPEPGIEPPLGFENPAVEESSMAMMWSSSIEATGAPVTEALSPDVQVPPSPVDDVETGAGAPFFSEAMAAQGTSQIAVPSGEDDAVRLARPPAPTDADNG